MTPWKASMEKSSTALISTTVSRSMSSGIGTVHYAAPEQQKSGIYSYPVDIFAAGYVIFEIFYIMSGLSERVRVFDQIRRAKPELPSNFIKKLITVRLEIFVFYRQILEAYFNLPESYWKSKS